MLSQNFIIIVILCVFLTGPLAASSSAQTLPPCAERPGYLDKPWVDGGIFCLELVIEDSSAGELAFTALAVAPDGTLYAARPLMGQLLAIEDTDADALPDTARVIAENLTLPNGLAYYRDALYISGGAHIYRWQNSAIETLVDDIPNGGGFWTGDVTIGPDERLYVTTSVACAYPFCTSDDPLRGAVLSYRLDGSDRQVVVTNLHNPVGIAFHEDVLWVTDSGQEADTLNRIVTDAAMAETALTFPFGSRPSMLMPYTSDLFPTLRNALLVVLRGRSNQVRLEGFAVAAVSFEGSNRPLNYTVLIPQESDTPSRIGFTLMEINYRMSGFWPHHPIDATVSSEGWVYISVGGGRIVVIRPA